MDLVGRWWNEISRGPERRDIWLHQVDDRWLVRARDGGPGGRELTWPAFRDEWVARAWVDRLIAASPPSEGRWRDVLKLVRKPPAGGWHAPAGMD
ncbi:hypothetical protein GCM10022251_28150 [Phytohabitans flavus]|uniref:hypothetical protein n=1 Tax=Phytohabitans flavus TaxID=1076124 RepID=UPI0031E908C9